MAAFSLPPLTPSFLQHLPHFPPTRYQGSKYKLLPWLQQHTQQLPFQSVLDVFGGTAAVSYLFKCLGKRVHYNDILPFNRYIGKALIEDHQQQLTPEDLFFLSNIQPHRSYQTFIADTFSGIYYTDSENQWLDITTQNILSLKDPHKQAMAFWALFQAALSKRPYNLFHRKNLHLRTSDVKRSFGNKTTWEKSFEDHFRHFAQQINQAVFCNHQHNIASSCDATELSPHVDLVYIDPPYIPKQGSLTHYRDFYHFLEGLVRYDEWPQLLDPSSKHKRLLPTPSPWEDKKRITQAFRDLFSHFKESLLVISYRADGIPDIETLQQILHHLGKSVSIQKVDYQYALSKQQSQEVLIIARKVAD